MNLAVRNAIQCLRSNLKLIGLEHELLSPWQSGLFLSSRPQFRLAGRPHLVLVRPRSLVVARYLPLNTNLKTG